MSPQGGENNVTPGRGELKTNTEPMAYRYLSAIFRGPLTGKRCKRFGLM
jgi:hypothetical protein